MLTPTLNLPTITQEVALNTIRFNRAFTEFENRISAFGHRMTNMGIATSLALSIPLQVITGAMVKKFVDLDESVTAAFSKIQHAGLGVKQALYDAADATSRMTSTSAVDLAGGLKELIASGYSARDAIAALDTTNKFAIAGEIDMTKATGTLITVMSSLGLRTGETAKDMATMNSIASVLVKAADATRVGVEEFATALSHKALTAMKTVNMSLEEGVAVLMAYAQRGIEGARAGEYLNIMLRDLQTIAIKNADTWHEWGLEIYDVNGKIKPIYEILGMLEKRFAGASDEQLRMTLTALKFKDKSVAATLALMGASKEVENFTNVLKGAGTILDDTYKVRMSSLKNQFAITGNVILSVGRSIVTVFMPAFIGLNAGIRSLATSWFTLNEHQKKVFAGWLLFGAAIGPVIIALGVLIRNIGILGQVLYYVLKAIILNTIALIGWIVTYGTQFVVALIQGLVYLWETYQIFGLMGTALQALRAAQIGQAIAAVYSWLATLGPIGLVIAAVDFLIYLITGKDGLMWAFEGLMRIGRYALGKLNELATETVESMGDAMDSVMTAMISKMETFSDVTQEAKDGLVQMRAVLASTMPIMSAGYNVGGVVSGLGINAAMSGLVMNPALGASMAGFDQADFKRMMDETTSAFDDSLLGKVDKKQKQESAREGYSALQVGSAEEYRARVGGYDNQIVRLAQQQLAATQQTKQQTADAVEVLKRLETQGQRAPRLKASSLF